MIKGQVISGDFGRIIIRQKSDQKIELGELLIADTPGGKVLMQVYDLLFGSQISQQNLELISGLKLEQSTNLEFLEPELRNYNLALLKPMIFIGRNNAILCKTLPKFFSQVREVTNEDLLFLTKPKKSIFLGKLRSGSKILDVDINLDGEKVFCHHVLIPASTGKGKSLDGNEEVLIEQNNEFSIKSIGEIVNNSSNFRDSKVISMNPQNYSIDFKKITKFVRHEAPKFMYTVISESGREIMVTKDHNLYVLRQGELKLLKTQEITKKDYLPLPLKINTLTNQKEINLFEHLKNNNKIYVQYNTKIVNKLKSKEECVRILSNHFKKPLQAYNNFVIKKNKIKITNLIKLLDKDLSYNDLESIELTDQYYSTKLRAIYPLTKEFLQLIGYYIAEGCCSNDNCFRISCSGKLVPGHLRRIFRRIGLNYFLVKKKNKNIDLVVSSSIFTKILKKIGLGNVSGEKRLPKFFMNLPNENLRILLRTYFEGDGGVDRETTKKTRRFKISSTTKSKKLASDICLALYRFGILARCKKTWKRATNTNHKGDWYFRISISGKTNLIVFLSDIGFQFSKKNNILKGKLDYKENTNVDLIPCDPKVIRKIRLSLRLNQAKLSRLCNYCKSMISLIESGKRSPSRNLATTFTKIFKKQLSSLDHTLFKKLVTFSESPDPNKLADLINRSRCEEGLTLFELGKKSRIYTSRSKRYIENDLSRILAAKKVKNSPKIYQLGKFLLNYSKNKGLSNFAHVFEFNFQDWSKIIRKAVFALNFPNQAMQREKQKFGYYARRLKKGQVIQLKSLRQIAKLLVDYYFQLKKAELLINELEKLLNFRWDRVKEVKKIKYKKEYVYDLTVDDNKTFLAGHGGLFVHNSNLTSIMLWNLVDKDYCGILVLDPHDEYFGRNSIGLKDHPNKDKIIYYTINPPPGQKSLVINIKLLRPAHFRGIVNLSDPQQQALNSYYREYKEKWIEAIILEKPVSFKYHPDTLGVIRRTIMSLLNLELVNNQVIANSLFKYDFSGETTISNICDELEQGKIVIIDTSSFSGTVEILIGSMIAAEIFSKYKYYKSKNLLSKKPVISIVLEEAPRVLGKDILEKGNNIFSTIAREGRKFRVGLTAITQLPSLIPRQILANMNTKIILGIEMQPERQAIIESAAQDLSTDNRNIASLDKGEAIITSNFSKFAIPIKIPFFDDFVKQELSDKKEPATITDFSGIHV